MSQGRCGWASSSKRYTEVSVWVTRKNQKGEGLGQWMQWWMMRYGRVEDGLGDDHLPASGHPALI